jgi:aminopeptidase YwaD
LSIEFENDENTIFNIAYGYNLKLTLSLLTANPLYRMKKIAMLIWMVLLVGSVIASDSSYVRKIADTLASNTFNGRGYVNGGMQKAADFIAGEMKSLGLDVQRQHLQFPVNTFPGDVQLNINGVNLVPGKDFIVSPGSKSVEAKGNLYQQDSVTYVYDKQPVAIRLVDKLTWSVARSRDDHTFFNIIKKSVNEPKNFSCKVEAQFIKRFGCDNIIGTIKGKVTPDSVVVFTAHYDHLGAMGKDTYFPGANDNASGVALMLGLAKKMQQNPPPYTVVFIAFAAEEAGLVGSKYFVDHPLINLNKISFLVNLDLMGNGEEGITVVNATEFPQAFSLLQKINDNKKLLTAINSRGKAANSDHYWFTEKGVPSFFIYTLGERKAYHDIDDVAATVPWYEVNDLQELLISFADEWINR